MIAIISIVSIVYLISIVSIVSIAPIASIVSYSFYSFQKSKRKVTKKIPLPKTPNSKLHIPNSSFLISNSSFLIPHYNLIPNCSPSTLTCSSHNIFASSKSDSSAKSVITNVTLPVSASSLILNSK